MRAGNLDSRCAFERRAETPDGYGNVTDGSWSPLITIWGDLRLERGKERMDAGRLQSAVAANLRVRSSADSRGVGTADRVVIRGEVYAIRAIMEPPRSGMIEMTLERGVAS